MGRPTRCVPQYNPFISYNSGLTTTTSTSTTSIPENLDEYIYIPESGKFCPIVDLQTTTSTTLSPLEIDSNIHNCTLYNFTFDEQEIEFNIPENNSAIVRYQPCRSGIFVNQAVYENTDFCVAGTVGNNIRVISGNGNITKIDDCNIPNKLTTPTCTLGGFSPISWTGIGSSSDPLTSSEVNSICPFTTTVLSGNLLFGRIFMRNVDVDDPYITIYKNDISIFAVSVSNGYSFGYVDFNIPSSVTTFEIDDVIKIVNINMPITSISIWME